MRRLFAVLAAIAATFALGACPASRTDRTTRTPADSVPAESLNTADRDTAPREQPLAAADTATIARATDTTITNARPTTQRIASLDPLADSISDRMVPYAILQRVFVAATRGKRLLVDLGRYDGTLEGPKQKKAFSEAAKILLPVKIGERLYLRGPWGGDSATVAGFTVWNGRIVAALVLPPLVDTLARSGATLVALASLPTPDSIVKVDSAMPQLLPPPKPAAVKTDSAANADSASASSTGTPSTCARDSVSEALMLRVAELADSVAHVLESDTAKLTDRLKRTVKTQRSQAVGCFGKWRVMVFVNQSAGDYEYVHEIALLVDTAGVSAPLSVRDLRFKAHEVIRAFDVDGDNVDDLAVKGRGNRIGGTVILRFIPDKRRLEYVMGGFAWEVF